MDMGPGNTTDRYAVGYGAPVKRAAWRGRAGDPDSGSGMDNVRIEDNRDYRADVDLVFGRGGTEFRTRFTPGDRSEVIAALGERHLQAWRLMDAARLGPGEADLWALERVIARLRGGILPVAGELVRDAARDYLIGLKEDGTDRGHLDAEALERVIAMLGEK